MTNKSQQKPIVLVTGATGFVGRNLIDFLLANEYRVSVYAREKSNPSECRGLELEDWFIGDMEDTQALASACKTADAVVHLANLAHVGLSNQISFYRFNVEATRAVCEACRESDTQNLIYVSSALALDPARSAYALSKKLSEEVVAKAVSDITNRGGVLEAHILRPANIYGPGMKGSIVGLIRGIIERRMPPLPSLNNRFAMVSVYDVCRAIQFLIESAPVSKNCHLLTDGELYTPNRVESAIYEALHRNQPRWRSPRMLFYLGAIASELLNRSRLLETTLGLRTYNNLVSDRPLRGEELGGTLGFRPTRIFEDDLPSILAGESSAESLASV